MTDVLPRGTRVSDRNDNNRTGRITGRNIHHYIVTWDRPHPNSGVVFSAAMSRDQLNRLLPPQQEFKSKKSRRRKSKSRARKSRK